MHAYKLSQNAYFYGNYHSKAKTDVLSLSEISSQYKGSKASMSSKQIVMYGTRFALPNSYEFGRKDMYVQPQQNNKKKENS